jgi:hypothetical protein
MADYLTNLVERTLGVVSLVQPLISLSFSANMGKVSDYPHMSLPSKSTPDSHSHGRQPDETLHPSVESKSTKPQAETGPSTQIPDWRPSWDRSQPDPTLHHRAPSAHDTPDRPAHPMTAKPKRKGYEKPDLVPPTTAQDGSVETHLPDEIPRQAGEAKLVKYEAEANEIKSLRQVTDLQPSSDRTQPDFDSSHSSSTGPVTRILPRLPDRPLTTPPEHREGETPDLLLPRVNQVRSAVLKPTQDTVSEDLLVPMRAQAVRVRSTPAKRWGQLTSEPETKASRAHSPAPTIRVTIGRVEVRATRPPAPQQPRVERQRPRPALTLDEYLKQRNEGGM